MGLRAEGGKAAEHFSNPCGIDIGKGDAQFTCPCKIILGPKHRAGKHEKRGIRDEAFAKLV